MLATQPGSKLSSVQLSSVTRVLAIVSTLALVEFLPASRFNLVFLPILLAHYGLHLVTASWAFRRPAFGSNFLPVVLPVMILATSMTVLNYALVLATIFGFHTAFNDVYVTEAPSTPGTTAPRRW